MGQTCNSTVQLGIAAAVFCSFLACFSGINHIADLFVQFRLQMAVALLPMVIYLACTFKIHPAPKLLAFSLVALILNAVCVLWTTVKFWPLRIPIDHVLVSKNVITVARRVEPDLGSDHLPVYVELRSRK